MTTDKKEQPPFVIVGGKVWNGMADKPLSVEEILIKDGRIAEMGKTVIRPTGATIINLDGHTVMPGLMDLHVHVTQNPKCPLESITQYSDVFKGLYALGPLHDLLMNGFTTIRDACAFDHTYVTVDLKRAIQQGLIVGPRMFVAPHMISPSGGHGDLAGLMASEFSYALKVKNITDGSDGICKAVREEIRGGADWIKFAGSGGLGDPYGGPDITAYTQEEMNILVGTAHDLGIPVCTHVYGTEGVRRAVSAGVNSIEHGSLASAEDLSLMEKKNIFLVPTQYAILHDLDQLSDPKYTACIPAFLVQKKLKYAESLRAAAEHIAKSNIKIVFGTDAGCFLHKDNWKEFPEMVKHNIKPLRALKAATSTAAEMLNHPELGTLVVGKIADIIAVPGDPFQDINVMGKVDFVMKEGKIYKHQNP